MTRTLPFAALLALAACSGTTTPATVLVTPGAQAAVPAVQTLASLAAAQNKTVNQVVTDGQLFCKSGAGIIAVVGALSKPTSVTGQAAAIVAAACPIIDGVQTTPAPISAVPVVVSPTAAPLAKTP